MDKFVVDLDKVLDDFEKTEDEASKSLSIETSGYESYKSTNVFADIHFKLPSQPSLTKTEDTTPTPENCDRSIASYINEGTLAPDKSIPFDSEHHVNGFRSSVSLSLEDENSAAETMTDSDSVKSLTAGESKDLEQSSLPVEEHIVSSVSQSQESAVIIPVVQPFEPSLTNTNVIEETNSFKDNSAVVKNLPMDLSLRSNDVSSNESFGFPGPNVDTITTPRRSSDMDDHVTSLNSFPKLNKPTSFRKPLAPNTSLSTPTEDFGYSRVPGIPFPRFDSAVPQEAEHSASRPTSMIEIGDSASSFFPRCTSPLNSGQVPPKKKARPNSLLGLSVPTPPSELVRIEQEQKSLPEVISAPKSRRQFTLPLPPTSTIVADDISPSQPSPKPLSSPMDCYEEIENPLYRNTDASRPDSFPSVGPPKTVDNIADQPTTAPIPNSKGLQRPSFLPIPVLSVHPASQESSGLDGEEIGSGPPVSTTDSTLEVVTPDLSLPSPLPQSDSVSGDSPTASIASSASSAWSGIADDDIGRREPLWARDESSAQCMSCSMKFTVWRRRHHCRACGKLLCGQCCSWKSKLDFLKGQKEARVCAKCFQQIVRLESCNTRNLYNSQLTGAGVCPILKPISPQQPISSALKRHRTSIPDANNGVAGVAAGGGGARDSQTVKSVVFFDGIRPGGDLSEVAEGRLTTPTRPVDRPMCHEAMSSEVSTQEHRCSLEAISLVPQSGSGKLPPLVVQSSPDLILQEDPSSELIVSLFTPPTVSSTNTAADDAGTPVSPVVFAVTRNLHILVTRAELSCCGGQTCWCFTSRGLETIGQEEVVILLECSPQETLPPLDIFKHYFSIFEEARTTSTPDKKSPLTEFSCLLSHFGLFNTKELAGFLYIRPTYQCLQNLTLPPSPYLIGLLIHRWEAPWAKLFPLRLILRMGIQARYYPCPLVSRRDRGPLFAEVGHTVLQLLADFRDYRYTLPTIPGLSIHLSSGETKLQIPKTSYSALMKVVNDRQEDSLVLALGGVLSRDADSHLVCVQKEDEGTYVTQAISIENTERKVTGASFIVFNGSQRQTRCCIVEDGVIVQLKEVQLRHLLSQLHAGQPVTFQCDPAENTSDVGGVPVQEESIVVSWTEDVPLVQITHQSWVDNTPLAAGCEGASTETNPLASNFRVPPDHQLLHWTRQQAPGLSSAPTSMDAGGLKLNWTRVYTLQCPVDCEDVTTREPVDSARLADELAGAVVSAIGSHLSPLREQDLVRIAVRVTLDPEQVGYEVGCSNRDHVLSLPLPGVFTEVLTEKVMAMKRQSSADIIMSKAKDHLQGTRSQRKASSSVGEEDINVYLSTLRKKTSSEVNPKTSGKMSLNLDNLSDISMPESSEASSRKKSGSKFLKKKKNSPTGGKKSSPKTAVTMKHKQPGQSGSSGGPKGQTDLMTSASALMKKHQQSKTKDHGKTVERLVLPVSDSEFDISQTTTSKSSSRRKKEREAQSSDRLGSSGSSKPSTPEGVSAALYQTSNKAKLSYLQDDDSVSLGKEGSRFLKKKKVEPVIVADKEGCTTPKTPDKIRFADDLHGDITHQRTENTNPGSGGRGHMYRSRSLYSSDEDFLLSSSSGGVLDTPKKPSLKKPRTPSSPKKSDSSETSTIKEHVTIDQGDHPGSAEEEALNLDDMVVFQENFGDDDDDEISSIKEVLKQGQFKFTSGTAKDKPHPKKAEPVSKFDSMIGGMGIQFAEDLISEANSEPQSSLFGAKQQQRPESSGSEDTISENFARSPTVQSNYSEDFESSAVATTSGHRGKLRSHKSAGSAREVSSIHSVQSEEDEEKSSASYYSNWSNSQSEDQSTTYTESRSQSIKRSGDQIKVTSKKSIEIQTIEPGLAYSWDRRVAGEAYLGPQYGMNYVDPTPIAHFAVSPEALDAVTAYNPCTQVLNNLIREQLTLTQNFMARQKMVYDSMISSINSGYCYTTLQDTKDFIRTHRPKKLTFKQALKEVEQEMYA